MIIPTILEEGTIEYLFKDYSRECFETELTNPIEPVGRELRNQNDHNSIVNERT